MYKPIFVLLWFLILFNKTGMTTSDWKLPSDIKAILRCAPPNVYHRLVQYIKNGTYTGLTKLDMSVCNITNLTPKTFNFQAFIKVKILHLNNNRISRLPSNIFHSSALFTLEKLYMDHNEISYLSLKQFVHLNQLRYLGLSSNQFKNIQAGIFETNPLVRLSLSSNHLEKLPADLFAGNASATLRILQLRFNLLKETPPCLLQSNTSEGIFPKLEVLDLAHNNIKKLPPELFSSNNWSSLRKLYLQHNSIATLPPGVFYPFQLQNVHKNNVTYNNLKHSTNLKYLLLDHNRITSFSPKQFFYLHKLIELGITFNNIKYWEPGLFTSHSLITLRLSGNKLETVPGNLFAGNIYTTLKVLHLDRNLLTEVPQWLYKSNASKAVFSKLEVLNLCQNNINDLPAKLFSSTSWSSLKTIYLRHNNISSLPGGIFHSVYLYSLRKIDLSYNNLKTMPKYLFQNSALPKLNILKFNYNQITYLPEELFNSQYLQNVIVISFRHNRIKSIPENLFKHLPNLRHIDLQNNNIKHFSQAMLPKTSNNLCSLDLSHNKIISTGHLVKTILRSSQILNFKKCKLDISYNSLTVQQTNFFPLSIEPKQGRSQIEGELDFFIIELANLKWQLAKQYHFSLLKFFGREIGCVHKEIKHSVLSILLKLPCKLI